MLVNNAGVFAFQPLEDVTEAEFHRQFNINVLGSLLATQEALKHFGADGGSVINISSVVSESPVPTVGGLFRHQGRGRHADAGARDKNWRRATSGSTPSRRAAPRPKARTRSA